MRTVIDHIGIGELFVDYGASIGEVVVNCWFGGEEQLTTSTPGGSRDNEGVGYCITPFELDF
jgi:hypothetical protein